MNNNQPQMTINEFRSRCEQFNIQSASLRDDGPRGYRTVSSDEIKVGDEIILDNYFTLITAGSVRQSRKEALKQVDAMFPTDYEYDPIRSKNAGYPIYYSTLEGCIAYICDLNDRFEVNFPNGKSVNVWYEPQPEFKEYELEDALKVIDEAIYQIEDNIGDKLAKATGIDVARKAMKGAYSKIAEILKAQHPESKLLQEYVF